jgi:hypothetical protein
LTPAEGAPSVERGGDNASDLVKTGLTLSLNHSWTAQSDAKMPARRLQSYRDGSFSAANTNAVILGLVPGICRSCRLALQKLVFHFVERQG